MGLLTEGRYRHQFGTGTNQIDLAQQAKNVYTPKFQFESSLVSAMPSIFMGLTEKFANIDFSGGGGSGSSKPAEVNPNHDSKLSAGGEEIKAEINTIVTNNDCKEISDLAILQETKNNQANQLRTYLDDTFGEINNLQATFSSLSSEIASIEALQSKPENTLTQEERNLINTLEEKRNSLRIIPGMIETLESQQAQKTDELNKLLSGIQTLKSDIARVEQLSASLRRLEGRDGRDAIQNMTNENTSEFTRMFSQYMEIKNDPKKQNQAQRLLNNLHEFYNQNFANKSDIPTHVKNAYNILPPEK